LKALLGGDPPDWLFLAGLLVFGEELRGLLLLVFVSVGLLHSFLLEG
jgi:hypothetical protein